MTKSEELSSRYFFSSQQPKKNNCFDARPEIWNKDTNTGRTLDRIIDESVPALSSKYARIHFRNCLARQPPL